MQFHSHQPAFPLSLYIQNFWLYEGYESGQRQERILPSGTVELVFNLRDHELRIYRSDRTADFERYSGAIVSGPYGSPFGTDSAEEASVIGVHFKAGGALPFLGSPAHELANRHTDLENLWGRRAVEIHERLSATVSPDGRFRLLENLLLSRLRGGERRHRAVSQALDALGRTRGRSTTRHLASDVGLSEKRFIDLFRFEVGLAPKIFHRILRFQRVLGAVRTQPEPDWSELALQYGYFDQSHLIRDFVAFSGVSPADYVRRIKDLRSRGTHIKFNHLPLALDGNPFEIAI